MYRGDVDTGAETFPESWRTVATISWILTIAGIVVVAATGRSMGRSPWWLGPSTDPASPFALLLPLACVVVPLVAAFRRPLQLATSGVVCSAALLLISFVDFLKIPSMAVAMSVVAVASLLSSVAVAVATRHYR